MVTRKELEQEKRRYEAFLVNVQKEIDSVRDAELAPFDKKRTKLIAQRDRIVQKAQKGKAAFTEDQQVFNALSVFQKKELKKILSKIKKNDDRITQITDKHDSIKENTTTPIYKAQQELDLLIAEKDLSENPQELSKYLQGLSTGLTNVERDPTYAEAFERKLNTFKTIITELVQEGDYDLSTIRLEMDSILKQNRYQELNDRDDISFFKDAGMMSAKEIEAKEKKLEISIKFSAILEGLLAKIPEQKKAVLLKDDKGKGKEKSKKDEVQAPPRQQPIAAASSTATASTSVVRSSTMDSKPHAIINAATIAQQKSKPKTVADKIAHFEQLAKDNQQETRPKSKKP
ncbi:hypothetical protein [Candidatus Berkiella aquae]|uniref:Uncharacterized protein n=1 Tax=Candidatus Berkiella aquae TaxID=295108 RepID=A0A0Q9YIK8_9GAMM|nr:hypothetical protein [Candidatus Berkiella aquae]MCS5712237.1 hypothetical protein [Candidatus Berkiella aquae]